MLKKEKSQKKRRTGPCGRCNAEENENENESKLTHQY